MRKIGEEVCRSKKRKRRGKGESGNEKEGDKEKEIGIEGMFRVFGICDRLNRMVMIGCDI